MDEPRTEAGRALLDDFFRFNDLERADAALDVRAIERESLRLARDAAAKAFDEYLYGLSISPGGEACEMSVSYFRDSLLRDLIDLAAIDRLLDAP